MKKFIAGSFILLFSVLNIQNAGAETINFDSIIQKALDNSFDLKTSDINVEISKSRVDKAKTDYLPVVKTGLYTEYSQSLSKSDQTESIGDTVITPDTKMQSMLNTSVSYNIFDFGQRKRNLMMAQDDIEAKQSICAVKRRDLKLKIIDLYSNTLMNFKDLMAKEQIASVYNEIARYKGDQFISGNATKLDTIDYSINEAKINNEIEDLRMKLVSSLRDLSYYTNEEYNPDEVVISDFEERKSIPVKDKEPSIKNKNVYQLRVEKQDAVKPGEISLNLKYTPDYKSYQYKIDKKDKELEILTRENLPKVGMYMNYTLSGKDENNIVRSFQDFQNKNLALGLSTTFTPFDGIKTSADKRKVKLEIKKLKMERDQALADLKSKLDKLNEELVYYQRTYESNRKLLALLVDKLAELKRIAETHPENYEEILNEQIKLISQQLEIEKKLVNRAAVIKKNQIILEEIE